MVNHINKQKVSLLILTARSCLASYLIKACFAKPVFCFSFLQRMLGLAYVAREVLYCCCCGPWPFQTGVKSTVMNPSVLGVGQLLDHGFFKVGGFGCSDNFAVCCFFVSLILNIIVIIISGMCNVLYIECRSRLLFCTGKQPSLRMEGLLFNSPQKYIWKLEEK